jgi:hypothetical protein
MLGLERHVPDETQVVVRPPLTLPPDYNLMPPGTATPVSSDHEGAQAASESGMAPVPPPKEERGFFGRLLHFDLFGDDTDSTVPKPPASSGDGAPAAPDHTTPSDTTPPKN